MISVIIPVLNNGFLVKNLLTDIKNNIEKPKEIFVIDDGSIEDIKSIIFEFKDLKIKYIRHNKTMGFNYVCNEGKKLSTGDFISFLNDDIIINKYFFKKIRESFLVDWRIGIVCPSTVKNKKIVLETKDIPVVLSDMKKREGWAYTARRSFLKRIQPIPSILRTYCGDDYIFYCAKRLTYYCKKMTNNYIFHYGGLTVGKTKECSGERKKEKIKWNEYKSKMHK